MKTLFEADEDGVAVYQLDREEGRDLFDKAARRKMGMSGEEFLRRWDAGEYSCASGACSPEAFMLSMLIPFAR
jgi:hypothetical protein